MRYQESEISYCDVKMRRVASVGGFAITKAKLFLMLFVLFSALLAIDGESHGAIVAVTGDPSSVRSDFDTAGFTQEYVGSYGSPETGSINYDGPGGAVAGESIGITDGWSYTFTNGNGHTGISIELGGSGTDPVYSVVLGTISDTFGDTAGPATSYYVELNGVGGTVFSYTWGNFVQGGIGFYSDDSSPLIGTITFTPSDDGGFEYTASLTNISMSFNSPFGGGGGGPVPEIPGGAQLPLMMGLGSLLFYFRKRFTPAKS